MGREIPSAHRSHRSRAVRDTAAPAAGNDFDDFLRGKEPFVIDGALDAGKASADFFKGVLDDEDFRQRTTYLAMRVLYDRYRAGAV